MAVIKLTIHDFLVEIKPEKKETISLVSGTGSAQVGNYLYALVGFSMNKQMYQPTMIVADISINKTEGTSWASIKRDDIVKMFRFRQVSLYGDNDEIGNDFYVHEVIPEYKPDSMLMRLHIFSLDKLLTLKQTSRSFVGKKLGDDILENELSKYALPYDSKTTLAYNINFMKRLKFKSLATEKKKDDKDKKDEKKEEKKDRIVEHIFPYLVQYNESFYDMLARTTNRWGEFMY